MLSSFGQQKPKAKADPYFQNWGRRHLLQSPFVLRIANMLHFYGPNLAFLKYDGISDLGLSNFICPDILLCLNIFLTFLLWQFMKVFLCTIQRRMYDKHLPPIQSASNLVIPILVYISDLTLIKAKSIQN